ncbi:class I SAM-dependent methyltransferase [Pricia sp. S334]|uniref:Class I SAM-dependent methyltransferase n=1 Tax=Pricia mediterranea TaxID=3076079 RepID=A0ABU3LAH1_9FLAO|nr:class I SAM-dependent methyltransferase [Pricia sp. S334]MDT7830492.1 class I SAM-dependent methyltransferase [Pricia sp. S334]
MKDSDIQTIPKILPKIQRKSEEIGFNMPSDVHIGTLLKTLIASKPGGRFLELGTGIGLSLSWMVDGMDGESRLITVDNDKELIGIAKAHFGDDSRLEIRCQDGSQWIKEYDGDAFDLIFADAWPGKYSEIDDILGLVKRGGFYVIDDMCVQPNWPEGHDKKAGDLIACLEQRNDFILTKLDWSTGLVIAVRRF